MIHYFEMGFSFAMGAMVLVLAVETGHKLIKWLPKLYHYRIDKRIGDECDSWRAYSQLASSQDDPPMDERVIH